MTTEIVKKPLKGSFHSKKYELFRYAVDDISKPSENHTKFSTNSPLCLACYMMEDYHKQKNLPAERFMYICNSSECEEITATVELIPNYNIIIVLSLKFEYVTFGKILDKDHKSYKNYDFEVVRKSYPVGLGIWLYIKSGDWSLFNFLNKTKNTLRPRNCCQ